ncbi:Asp-tRNA(Asn)/Glu-tRNA(Gln) amidotransferase subunit GatA [Candidatus Woesearchaeota archaeon]|nr:Asp-tRNA(Asn)/Glu-tRNA(Gln) amidotransferase subunit GatA [Candidatus Woesearchaeota archaeon]
MTTPLQKHLQDVKSGRIDLVHYVETALQKAEDYNHRYHYFTTICREHALRQAEQVQQKIKQGKAGNLAGLLISVKDNICVEGVESTAGARILQGYTPVFTATAIQRLEHEDAIVIGKTNQDSFGFGSFNTNVGKDSQISLNPHDSTRTTGGSSGGAGGITAVAEFVHVAIAESTGGSIEAPAAFCGVIGFCPTYGYISRYGLISYADSLDKIGVMSREVADILPVLRTMSGFDKHDGTSLPEEQQRQKLQPTRHNVQKIGIIKDSFHEMVSPEVQKQFKTIVETLQEKGIHIEETALPFTSRYGIPTYYILSTAEASTNLARFCGLRYGPESSVKGKSFSEYFTEIRSEYLEEESKRRIILGSFVRRAGYREAYYLKAAKVRTKIIEEYKNLFEKYDVLISPTMPLVAPTFAEISKLTPMQHYLIDTLTVGPNLAGIPHASIPIGSANGLPIGMMAMTNHLEEEKLIQFLTEIEQMTKKENQRK